MCIIIEECANNGTGGFSREVKRAASELESFCMFQLCFVILAEGLHSQSFIFFFFFYFFFFIIFFFIVSSMSELYTEL